MRMCRTTRQEKEARRYFDLQTASPKQPMRQGNAKCRMQNAESVDRPKFMLHFAFCILHCVCNRVCKPGSVLDSHLSCRTVADTLCATSSETAGPANVSSTVLLRIEFTAPDSLQPASELLPHFSTLAPPEGAGRFLSVALFLKSPSAGVTRYPCPVEPGLSSRWAFRPSRAAVRPGCRGILARFSQKVNGFSAAEKKSKKNNKKMGAKPG